jgi:predicted  nucleic acid-binding Zn-ribbon protein
MSVTLQLLKLFQVDKQLRGLRSRLDGAEKFLAQQKAQLKEIDDKKNSLDAQVKQLRASQANDEGEAARVETRINTLREQMNSMKTAKEYGAAVSELNNYKEAKTKAEESALESMTKVEQLEGQLAELKKQREERAKLVAQADTDRTAREAEIKDRLEELKAQRAALAKDIPQDALNILEGLIKMRGDDAMCSVEILDRRNHEYSCSGCMMTLPVEVVNTMLAGRLTRCVSCSCIVYTEEENFLGPPPKQSKSKQVAKT